MGEQQLIFVCILTVEGYSKVDLVTTNPEQAAIWYSELPRLKNIQIWYKESNHGGLVETEIISKAEALEMLRDFYNIIPK